MELDKSNLCIIIVNNTIYVINTIINNNMLEKLFLSNLRYQVLNYFFVNNNKKSTASEIAKNTKQDPGNVLRELQRLEKFNLLTAAIKGRRRQYALNWGNEYTEKLNELFNVENNSKTDVWFYMEEMPNYYPQMAGAAWNVKIGNEFLKNFGLKNRFSESLTIYRDNMCGLLMLKNEFNNLAKEMVDKISTDYGWAKKYIDAVIDKQAVLIKETDKLKKINLTKLSGKELFKLYDEYYNKHYVNLHRLHWVHSCLDFGDNLFSHHLMDYLKSRIGSHKYSSGDIFSVLTTPLKEGSATKEYKDLLKILDLITRDGKLKKFFVNTETRIINKELPRVNALLDKKIKDHAEKYGWIGYGSAGPCWSEEYFIDILASLARQKANPRKLLRDLKTEQNNLARKQRKYYEELKINANEQKLFTVAQDIIYTKGIRKDSMFYSWSVIECLFREMGRRYYLSVDQIRFMYPHEIKELLSRGKFDLQRINTRKKLSVYHSIGGYEGDHILEGKKAEEFLEGVNIIKEEISDIKVLLGDTAASGRVRGAVKIINLPSDMEKMKKGDVLVSIATAPDLVPAIKKASAIVTDMGGITCHAAIISRELNIPCVVGTKIATKVLKDGYIIDVDATHGKVNIIKKN